MSESRHHIKILDFKDNELNMFKTKKAKIHSNLLGLKQVSWSGVTFINGKNTNLERARESQRPIPNKVYCRMTVFFSLLAFGSK